MNKSEMNITMGRHIFSRLNNLQELSNIILDTLKSVVKLIEIFVSLGCMTAVIKWE